MSVAAPSRSLRLASFAAMGLAALAPVAASLVSDGDRAPVRYVAAAANFSETAPQPGFSGVLIASLAYDGTPEPPPTPIPTPTPVPRTLPASPEGLRLWSDGDSTSYFMTVALMAEWAARGGIPVRVPDYKISSGLWRPDFFDWPAYIQAEMATYDPDVVVLMLGANDANQITSLDEYGARVGRAMDLLRREGRIVVWMGQPNMGRADLAATIPAVNRVFQEQAATRPWVIYVDTWALTSWSDGTYAPALPDESGVEQALRGPDGVHFTTAGGRRLALGALAALFATP
ncbi:MAG TPA: GDSL-type esterase/lipase family protein [Tepidiformaceae bacterium]|nr:GDSL-type esterase/lipase family protein [Tepidiformaceae bacterium]